MYKIGTSIFDERKAAQAAAFLLFKAGGQLSLLKLMKLMYLAERESLRQYGETITGDAFVSMQHGPVLSTTYNHMTGSLTSSEGGWETWISDRAGNMLALQDPSMLRTPEQDLLALSETDLECLDATWAQFGHIAAWRLRDMTHEGLCPEWVDPNGSSRPIPLSRVLKALGYSPDQIESLDRRLHEQRQINAAFR